MKASDGKTHSKMLGMEEHWEGLRKEEPTEEKRQEREGQLNLNQHHPEVPQVGAVLTNWLVVLMLSNNYVQSRRD